MLCSAETRAAPALAFRGGARKASKSVEIDGPTGRFGGTQRWSQNPAGLFGNPCFSAVFAHSRHRGRESHSLRQLRPLPVRSEAYACHGYEAEPGMARQGERVAAPMPYGALQILATATPRVARDAAGGPLTSRSSHVPGSAIPKSHPTVDSAPLVRESRIANCEAVSSLSRCSARLELPAEEGQLIIRKRPRSSAQKANASSAPVDGTKKHLSVRSKRDHAARSGSFGAVLCLRQPCV